MSMTQKNSHQKLEEILKKKYGSQYNPSQLNKCVEVWQLHLKPTWMKMCTLGDPNNKKVRVYKSNHKMLPKECFEESKLLCVKQHVKSDEDMSSEPPKQGMEILVDPQDIHKISRNMPLKQHFGRPKDNHAAQHVKEGIITSEPSNIVSNLEEMTSSSSEADFDTFGNRQKARKRIRKQTLRERKEESVKSYLSLIDNVKEELNELKKKYKYCVTG